MQSVLEKYFDLIKRIIPSKAPLSAVGVDIGSGECKLIELRRKQGGFELSHYAVESIVNGDARGALQKVLDKLDPPCHCVNTAVFGKGTLIRYITMPRMSLQDLRNSFSIEADKYFPFSQDQIYTDCCIIDSQSDSKQMSVMAVAAKKELVDQRIKLLTDIGLHVDYVGINAVALVNAVQTMGTGEEMKDKAVALLDMGEAVSNLTIMINNMPCFNRDIFIGGRDLTKSVSNALGIGFPEAEALKASPGDRMERVASVCESVIVNIVQELRLSFDYFTTEKNKEIACLLLTGGGSMLTGIADVFAKNLDIKVTPWNPLSSVTVDANVPVDELKARFPTLGVALGLALSHES